MIFLLYTFSIFVCDLLKALKTPCKNTTHNPVCLDTFLFTTLLFTSLTWHMVQISAVRWRCLHQSERRRSDHVTRCPPITAHPVALLGGCCGHRLVASRIPDRGGTEVTAADRTSRQRCQKYYFRIFRYLPSPILDILNSDHCTAVIPAAYCSKTPQLAIDGCIFSMCMRIFQCISLEVWFISILQNIQLHCCCC